MAWVGEELWVVNTAFSCLCTLDERHSFAPRWKPKFVSALVAEDRCHLNGLACVDGRAKLVTALAETDTAGGWRDSKATTGCLIDVESGETLVRGLAMPHSPRCTRERHGCWIRAAAGWSSPIPRGALSRPSSSCQAIREGWR